MMMKMMTQCLHAAEASQIKIREQTTGDYVSSQ